MRWAVRSHAHYYRGDAPPPGGLFGIVQGGMHAPLRLASLEALLRLEWPGLAVGGLAVGESAEQRLAVLESLTPHMPPDRPRYLMGVGRPEDIVAAVLRGIDLFDCVMPTRHARNGHLFTAVASSNRWSYGMLRLGAEDYFTVLDLGHSATPAALEASAAFEESLWLLQARSPTLAGLTVPLRDQPPASRRPRERNEREPERFDHEIAAGKNRAPGKRRNRDTH